MSLGGSKIFYSNAKWADGRYLSTMQVSPKPLVYKGGKRNLFQRQPHSDIDVLNCTRNRIQYWNQ